MFKIINQTISNLFKLPLYKILPIIIVHALLTKYFEPNLIYSILVIIPLNTGCSYMIYKSLEKDKISVKGMFDGYKFCKKTRIVFFITYIIKEFFLWILIGDIIKINDDIKYFLIWLNSTMFYIVTYKVSFMRYFSMEGFCGKEKKLNLVETVKSSLHTSKHTTFIYIFLKIAFMALGIYLYYITSNLLFINKNIYKFIYLIFAQIFDESIRISIYQVKKQGGEIPCFLYFSIPRYIFKPPYFTFNLN